MTKEIINSPCIRHCCLDIDDVCVGCFRTIDEICQWQSLSDEKKKVVLNNCAHRKVSFKAKQSK